MIATHSTKLTNAKAKQAALCADIVATIPKHLVCSQTTSLQKKYYACPLSAAEMKVWRHFSEQVNNGNLPPLSAIAQAIYSGKVMAKNYQVIPDIQDGRAVKQILLPQKNWRYDDYICASPLSSMGLLRELWLRVTQKGLRFVDYTLESTPAAYANHGELLLDQAGRAAILLHGIRKQERTRAKTSGVCLSFIAQDMNIASGFLSKGLPALTAIGGFAHVIERQTNQSIDFAVGFNEMDWGGRKKFSVYKSPAKPAVPNFTYEATGTAEVHLMLRCEDNEALYHSLKNKMPTRFAGGSIFSEEIMLLENERPPEASYLTRFDGEGGDVFDDVLEYIKWDRKAKLKVPTKAKNLHRQSHSKPMSRLPEKEYFELLNKIRKVPTLLECGYAFLETPKKRNKSRNSYPHGWAEPLYLGVHQTGFSKDCYFKRYINDGFIHWDLL